MPPLRTFLNFLWMDESWDLLYAQGMRGPSSQPLGTVRRQRRPAFKGKIVGGPQRPNCSSRRIPEGTENAERENCRWLFIRSMPTVDYFQTCAEQLCMHVASVDLAVVIAQGGGGESPAP